MAAFALFPLFINEETNRKKRSQIENWTWLFLLIGATAMTVFSGYLMYILFTVLIPELNLTEPCYYCIFSAISATSLLIFTIVGKPWEDLGEMLFTGLIVAVVTLVGTLGVYANVGNTEIGEAIPIPVETTRPQPPKGWEVNTTSGDAEIALAEHLTKAEIKMYGAFWCPHCHEQKLLFGKEALEKLEYIECAEGGENAQPLVCRANGIEGYPAWQIDGEIQGGVQSLQRLASLSGYEGNTNFKYKLR
jgi:glutaredoxin